MKKILISLSVIAAVAAVVAGVTTAYFSDTETSTGNTFTAGAIDLKIDNTSYLNRVLNPGTTWRLNDLTGQLFFNFTDLKPGDMGEDTVSLHVDNNNAWACVAFSDLTNDDVSCTEPEMADDATCNEPDTDLLDGELAQALNFVFWVDDGDNVLETNERVLMQGPASDVLAGRTYVLADSAVNNVGGTNGQPLQGSHNYYVGKAWCFGTLGLVPVAPGANDPTQTPGVTCNGQAVNNASQSDRVTGTISFNAVQARNNPNFTCVEPTRIDRTQPGFSDGGWAGWSCPAGTTAVGGGIVSSTNPVGGHGVAAPGAPAVDTYNYPVYPHYTFGIGETGYVVHDLVDGLGNTISFYVLCLPN